jgi:hypothetical protein
VSNIENTTDRMKDPADMLLFLAEAMSGGSSAPIVRQERDGQQQLVHSDRLPAKMGDQSAYEALGFTFGPVDESDPLFRPATIPDGWEKRATDHSMGSVIVDPLGRERITIFYKAAFYDRSAHMTLIGLHWYVTKHVEYDGPLVLDEEWATAETVAAAMAAGRDEALERAAEFRGYAGDAAGRDPSNRAACAGHADEYEAKAAKYEAAMAKLGA